MDLHSPFRAVANCLFFRPLCSGKRNKTKTPNDLVLVLCNLIWLVLSAVSTCDMG
uniref:Uncharacterized protein n=1 Tax=Anopheles dirus TaxID=7168 RepID=A0A182NW84_9DIPT